jgi:hypothetical protein
MTLSFLVRTSEVDAEHMLRESARMEARERLRGRRGVIRSLSTAAWAKLASAPAETAGRYEDSGEKRDD